ncbi:MAG: phosphoribosylglycinamide formyltransferase [Myxococcota bacterium]
MLKLVVLASGRGSNAKAIFELAEENPELLAVEALITNNPNAGVLEHAAHYEIPAHVIPVVRQSSREATRHYHETQIQTVLDAISFDYICLAGYMRILTGQFVQQHPHPVWPCSKIINIHPALLPAFKGANGYEDAFEYGVTVAGITIHFVSPEVDSGPIIHQRYFKRKATDSLDEFKARGLVEEHLGYRRTLLALATDTVIAKQNPFQLFLS